VTPGDKVRHWLGGEAEIIAIRPCREGDGPLLYNVQLGDIVLVLKWWNGMYSSVHLPSDFTVIEPNPVQPKYVEMFL
jgi:hypothetical protein